jgi:hypothetical protein
VAVTGLILLGRLALLGDEPAGGSRLSASIRPVLRETAEAASLLALVLTVSAPTLGISWLHPAAGLILTATAFLLAPTRGPLLAGASSTLGLGTIVHVLAFQLGDAVVPQAWCAALLTHATLSIAAVWAIRRTHGPEYEEVLARPLRDGAVVTSGIAALLALGGTWSATIYLLWLAAVWLGLAVMEYWPLAFSGFQAALTAAVFRGVATWLGGPIVLDPVADVLAPDRLPAYTIALGALSLGWATLRIPFARQGRVPGLLDPGWPRVDRIVLAALVFGQLAGALVAGVAGVGAELAHGGRFGAAPGSAAWVALLVVGLALLAALWERWRAMDLAGALIVGLTGVLLVAGRYAPEVATASALRWGLALFVLAVSILVWLRDSLDQLARAVGARVDEKDRDQLSWLVRSFLLWAGVAPTIALTAWAAMSSVAVRPAGPAPGSFFGGIGPTVNGLAPLVVLVVALVGHAVRERAPGYAFGAGLVANLAVTGGYALDVALRGQVFDAAVSLHLLQLAAGTAAAWAVLWMAGRAWLAADRDVAIPTVLGLQVALPVMIQTALLAWTAALTGLRPTGASTVTYLSSVSTATAWIVLGLTIAATAWFCRVARERHALDLLCLTGLGVPVVAAGVAAPHGDWWAFRTVMLGWAGYAPLVAALTWAASVRRDGPSVELAQAAKIWVRAAGVLAGGLALRATLNGGEHAWAAAAIALAGLGSALLGVWWRAQGWAFAAALAGNLAASLLVWHVFVGRPLHSWWIELVQANVAVCAGLALVWFGIRAVLARRGALRPLRGGPLELLVGLGVAGQILLVAWAIVQLLDVFGVLGVELGRVGSLLGWAAWAVSLVAALRYAREARRGDAILATAVIGVSLGAMVAATVARWPSTGDTAHHVVTVLWLAVGLLGMLPGWVTRIASLVDLPAPTPANERSTLRATSGTIAALLVALGWRAAAQGDGLWSVTAAVAASVVVGAQAIRIGLPTATYVSGLLLALAGALAWWVRPPLTLAGFVYAQIFSLSVASCVWSGIAAARRGRGEAPGDRLPAPGFPQVAAVTTLGMLGLMTASALGAAWTVSPPLAGQSALRGWSAVAATGIALALGAWQPAARAVQPGLYAWGVFAIGLGLAARAPASSASPGSGVVLAGLGTFVPASIAGPAAHDAVLALAGYVLLVAAAWRLAPRFSSARRALGLPAPAEGWTETWQPVAQGIVGGVAVILSVWVALGLPRGVDRLAAPLAAAALVGAAVLAAGRLPAPGRRVAQDLTLALAVLVLAELGWAALEPAVPTAWLDRGAVLVGALSLGALACGLVARAPQVAAPDWAARARRFGPRLAALAVAVAAGVATLEVMAFTSVAAVMSLPGIAAMAGGLAALAVALVWFAVAPGPDPFELEGRFRTVYVYAAEAIVLVAFLHIRLALPHFFVSGLLARHWMWATLGLAYLATALGEVTTRRGSRIVGEALDRTALVLPLLPDIVFWLVPDRNYLAYAGIWLLQAALYGGLAAARDSRGLAMLGASAANVGVWVLLGHHGVEFLRHPQMWLIPFAINVLLAGHLNRNRLGRSQRAALNYAGLSLLYLSSAADLFIAGLGDSTVLPLALAALSMVGIVMGIVLRVRAFLFQGMTFLAFVVVTMIVHAVWAREQQWLMWVSGIGLGAAAFTVFAVFRKYRDEVLQLYEEVRSWS